MAIMAPKVMMDKAGRIVISKAVRDKLELAAGDELEGSDSSDDRLILRRLRGTAQLRKERGVWVSRYGGPLSAATVDETLEQIRRGR